MKTHPPEKKAEAVALLKSGASITEVSRTIGLPYTTIRVWRDEAIDPRSYLSAAKQEINALLVDLVKETLITLITHQGIYRDEKWVKQQSANSIAVLDGVAFDKMARVIDALNGADTSGSAEERTDEPIISRVHSESVP